MQSKSLGTLCVLDFDCECRPLSWYGGDFNSKEITAISWATVSRRDPRKAEGPVQTVLLGEHSVEEMIESFRAAYDASDIVTGHFIRGFDLPLLNGAAIELGLQPFGPKLTQDTKNDLVRFSGHSKSQENLGAMLGLKHPKVTMTQADWREANRLSPDGLEIVRKRVDGDVLQHIELRAALLERRMLGPMKSWSGAAHGERYQP